MGEPLRILTAQGIKAFQSNLDALKGTEKAPDPALLLHSAWTKRVPGGAEIAPKFWGSRLEAVRDLKEVLASFSSTDALLRDPGLWAWLSLAFFDSVCPPSEDGTRVPGMDYRHIPSEDQRYRHRHLLRGPFEVYRQYGEAACHLLLGKVSEEGSLFHEIAGRQDLISNPAVVGLTRLLYYDERHGRLRPGALARSKAGSAHRLISILMQLDLTYDLHGMEATHLLQLLPSREFEQWLKSRG